MAVTRTVSAQALVAYRGNAYSVPPGLAGTTVQVAHRFGAATLDIAAGAVVLAQHHREPDGAGVLVRDTGHVVALELEEHPADGGGGVHALVEDHQIDLALLENAGGLAEVSSGAPEPVELGDHQLVPGAGDQQCLVKLGPPGELAGGLLDKHRLAAGRDQGVVLDFGVLVAGGDPGVADPHCRTAAQTPERVTQARTRVALHVCPAETQNRHGCLVERSSADAAQRRLALREPAGTSPLVTRSLTAPRVAGLGELDRR